MLSRQWASTYGTPSHHYGDNRRIVNHVAIKTHIAQEIASQKDGLEVLSQVLQGDAEIVPTLIFKGRDRRLYSGQRCYCTTHIARCVV